MEQWKDIEGYEGIYRINEVGEIQTKHYGSWRKLKPSIRKDGYYAIGLNLNKKTKWTYVHRLVALHFIPNPDGLPQVDHIDNDKGNNNVENLRWVTHRENSDKSNKRRIGMKYRTKT